MKRLTEFRMHLPIEASKDVAIFTIDTEGKVETWTPGASRLLGYAKEEVSGKSACLFLTEEDNERSVIEQEMQQALQHGRHEDERWHKRKNGTHFWASIMIVPLQDDLCRTDGFLKIIHYTVQMEAQEKLRLLNEELSRRLEEQTKELVENQNRLRSLVLELNKVEHMEQQRIAAELHDNPAQLLASAQVAVSSAMKKIDNEKARNCLQKVKRHVSDAYASIQDLMRDLSAPGFLEHGDLLVAIQWVAGKIEKSGLPVEISCTQEKIAMERDWLLVLFQSVRELLQNVHKYANASKAFITIYYSETSLNITVVDHGKGFDVSERIRRPASQYGLSGRGRPGGFGLLNIHERIRALGGDFQIESAPGEGTQAKIRLPNAKETP